MDIVVLFSHFSQSSTNFLFFFITKLPRWNHIVWFKKRITGNKSVADIVVISIAKIESQFLVI